jgi:inner membrane protein
LLELRFVGDLTLLRNLVRENCQLNAWMRFARAPQVTATEAVDARFYTGGVRANFSQNVPQWSMPRADLLEE